jgi:hypothetical protein
MAETDTDPALFGESTPAMASAVPSAPSIPMPRSAPAERPVNPDNPSWYGPGDEGYLGTQVPDAVLKAAQEAKERQVGRDIHYNQQQVDRLERDRADMQRYRRATEVSEGQIPQPWNADKERAERMQTPMERFGNAATIFAMIASQFTRTPMISALNAGAAAMNALNERDEKGYQAAHQAWKDNTDLAIKRFEMQEKMFNQSQHLFDTDIKAWTAQQLASAAMYKDETAQALLKQGMFPEYFESMKTQAAGIKQMAEARHSQDVIFWERGQLNSVMARIDGMLKADPTFRATPDQIHLAVAMKGAALNAARNKDDAQRIEAEARLEYYLDHGLKQQMPEAEARKIYDDVKYHTEGKLSVEQQKAEYRSALQTQKDNANMERLSKRDADIMDRLQLTNETKIVVAGMNIDARREFLDRTLAAKTAAQELSIRARDELQTKSLEVRKEIAEYIEGGKYTKHLQNMTQKDEFEKLHAANKLLRAEQSDNLKREIKQMEIEAGREKLETQEGGRNTRFLQGLTSLEKRTQVNAETRITLANLRDATIERNHQENLAEKRREADQRFEAAKKAKEEKDKPTMSDEDARMVAKRYVASGDRFVMSGLAWKSPNRDLVQHYIDEEIKAKWGDRGSEMMANRVIEWESRKTGARTIGNIEARMTTAAAELMETIPLAEDAIKKVNRTQVLPLNRLIELGARNLLSTDQVRLQNAFQSVANAYASVMSRGANITTDSARQRAHELMDTAYNKEAALAGLDQMKKEMNAALQAPQMVREMFAKRYGDRSIMEGPPVNMFNTSQSGGQSGRDLKPEDAAALKWIMENPGNPKASQIRRALEQKGVSVP